MSEYLTIDALCDEVMRQSVSPPANDERIAAFSHALIDLKDEPGYTDLIHELVSQRRQILASYAANLLLRGFQYHLWKTDVTYPADYIDVATWKKGMNGVMYDEERSEQFYTDVMTKNVQSNVVERYKAIKLTVNLLHERLGDGVRMLDVACSRNHGLAKLKLNLPFNPIRYGHDEAGYLPGSFLDKTLIMALRQPMSMGKCVGSDIIPIANGQTAEWTRNCSFYPSELLNKAALNEYDYLDTASIPGVKFEVGDFTNPASSSAIASAAYEVVIASTFLYQLTHEQRETARKIFRTCLSEAGVAIYLDFAIPSSDSTQLNFKESWFDESFPYRTLVEFGNDPSGKVYELFRWDTGRCNEWIPGKDMKKVLEHE